jgi:hypothetical protein
MSNGESIFHKVVADATVAETIDLGINSSVDSAMIQTVVESMTGTSIDVALQHSLDGINWENKLTNTQFITPGSEMVGAAGQNASYWQLVYTPTAITAGVVKIHVKLHSH